MTDEFDVQPQTAVDDHDEDTTTKDADAVYGDEESAAQEGRRPRYNRGDSADEIDPRKLSRDPSLSEVRWYYRRTFANVLVNKPIEDAFKNGFQLESDGESTEWANRILNETGYVDSYMMAEKKARRDGFALVFIGTRDTTDSLAQSPFEGTVEEITHTKVLTIDDLVNTSDADVHEQVSEQFDLDREQYEVRKTGIVINTDITSEDYKNPIGYVLDQPNPKFVHADRVQHLVWNDEVDGDYHPNDGPRRFQNQATLGKWEGDSVLVKSYDLLKGMCKGNWSIMQALFRNAAHLYTAEMPENADEGDYDYAESALTNLNAKSEVIHPHGIDVTQHESGNALEPEEYFEVVFDQICACHEMTKSVLFGTQAGTVSGSEVDIKNYFNKVERFRNARGSEKIIDFLTMARKMKDGRTSSTYRYDVEIDWNAMFKISEEDRLEMLRTTVNAVNMAIGGYIMTPDEGRELLTEDFVEIEFDNLTEEQYDTLDRINLNQVGAYEGGTKAEAELGEGEAMENPREQNGGGMPQGNSTSEMADSVHTDGFTKTTKAMMEHF